MPAETFTVWATGCAHVGTESKFGRESLAEAIRQSEHGGDEGGPPFHWDIMLHLGDLSGIRALLTMGKVRKLCGSSARRNCIAVKTSIIWRAIMMLRSFGADPMVVPQVG